MTIQQLKSQLTIETVLAHYGLSMNRNKMLCCPFHDDQKASMRIYPETNTAYCFTGSCAINNLDVIDFIWKMDRCSKHEAIQKAKSLCHYSSTVYQTTYPTMSKPNLSDEFKAYQKSLHHHKLSQQYCESRTLSWRSLEIGYKSQKAKDKWGRACIIFPLLNASGEIVSLYGRGIRGSSHYYQSGRSGLYPGYPKAETKTLILCESIIDTATLQTLNLPLENYALLSLYGTNGLTKEHLAAIKKLKDLQEIIYALDGDEAGQQAIQICGDKLAECFADLQQSYLPIPLGEDVNSLAVGHEDHLGLFTELIKNRKPLEKKVASKAEKSELKPGRKNRLNTADPYNLIYLGLVALYYIKGGIRFSEKDLDSLKVTLVAENKTGRKSRHKLDLYEDKQVEKVSRYIGEKLDLRPDQIELDIQSLTDEVEQHQRKLYESGQQKEAIKKVVISEKDKQQCFSFLSEKNLLDRINELIGNAGIIGEQMNRLLLFIVASSYKMPQTLHALIQGSSGSGKTRLLKVVRELMPEEGVKSYTRVTDGSLYNQSEYHFKHKLLCFEDLDGLKEEALLAVRELQSNEILRTSSSGKDINGNIRGVEIVVRGPIGSISCTTKAQVYEDNISRCFVVAVDESAAQDEQIITYQNERAAGIIDKKGEGEVKVFMQNCIRLLQPLEVINPYAHKIKLPKSAHKIRRLNELYQSFVCQITLLHQYQRKRDKQGRLITEKEDLEQACEILFESIVLKVDELDGSLRQFFEKLKSYVKSKGKTYEFNRFEIREVTGVSKTQQHFYLTKLIELEYLKQYGFANRGYRYKVAHWDDMSALRSQIKNDLLTQLKQL